MFSSLQCYEFFFLFFLFFFSSLQISLFFSHHDLLWYCLALFLSSLFCVYSWGHKCNWYKRHNCTCNRRVPPYPFSLIPPVPVPALQLMKWLTDWLIDLMTHLQTDLLTDWLTHGSSCALSKRSPMSSRMITNTLLRYDDYNYCSSRPNALNSGYAVT